MRYKIVTIEDLRIVINMFINIPFHTSVDFNRKCYVTRGISFKIRISVRYRHPPAKGIIFFAVLYLEDFIV